MKAEELASFLKAEILGDASRQIRKPGYLTTAKTDELAYCSLDNDEKDLEAISKTNAGIVICHKRLREKLEQTELKPTLILSEAPRYDFARTLQQFFVKEKPRISRMAYISQNVKIGNNVTIDPFVVVYDSTVIGDRVIVRANAVLGVEGMNYGRGPNDDLKRVPHQGKLIIEDDVYIGALTQVQKGTFKSTVIGEGSKIGPQCDIGHQVKIGRHCLVTGMTLVAGHAEIGDYTYIGPGSTIKNGVKIGRKCFVGIGSLVMDDVPDGVTVVGRPAIEIGKFREQRERLKRLLSSLPSFSE